MKIEDRVKELVEEKIMDRQDLFLVDITMQKSGRLLILMDGDNGINIKDCAAISRHVGYYLEEENVIEDAYKLEVSSPGIDTPLTMERQYANNVGRRMSIKSKTGEIIEGKLLEVAAKELIVEISVKEKKKKAELVSISIPKEDIVEIKVLISFN